MRVFSTIFITYILLLIAAPSLFLLASSVKTMHCERSCCGSKDQPNSPVSKKSNECAGGFCNPFMNCSNCYALISGLHVSAFFTYADQKFNALTENLNSAFLSDAWHPPKLI